jgi:hypothetical protein
MATSLIQLPPIIVRSSSIQKVEDAITNVFKTQCIRKCSFEEQNIALISFLPMQSSVCMEFYNKLRSPVTIQYNGAQFMIESQYYTNI